MLISIDLPLRKEELLFIAQDRSTLLIGLHGSVVSHDNFHVMLFVCYP